MNMNKQFEFSIIVEAEDIFKAKDKAIEIFGKEVYENDVYFQQIFKIKNKEGVKLEEPLSFEL